MARDNGRHMLNARTQLAFWTALLASAAIVGCGGGSTPVTPPPGGEMPPAAPPGAAVPANQTVQVTAMAGVPVSTGDAAKLQKDLMPQKATPPRPDPFALLAVEQTYEKSQLAENFAANGGFGMLYEAPAEVESEPEVEPQPYRRLAGVLVGDSVSALIDMGNGSLTEIHPGQRIQGTEWMVQSIDAEKAILRRVGSKKLPTEVVVRLESPPAGVGTPTPAPNPTVTPGQNPPARNPGGRGGKFGGGGGGG